MFKQLSVSLYAGIFALAMTMTVNPAVALQKNAVALKKGAVKLNEMTVYLEKDKSYAASGISATFSMKLPHGAMRTIGTIPANKNSEMYTLRGVEERDYYVQVTLLEQSAKSAAPMVFCSKMPLVFSGQVHISLARHDNLEHEWKVGGCGG